MRWYSNWAPYVPVAERKKNAAKAMAARRKKGLPVDPVSDVSKKIATTAWGRAWCDGLDSHASYANRLERGLRYVRNGSVVHLAIREGAIESIVSGSELYDVRVKVEPVSAKRWRSLIEKCAGQVRSALDVLRGKLSDDVMKVLSAPKDALIPVPGELKLHCSCPDGVGLCKHVAATLYGVGARLDHKPELLFVLRGVSAADLVVDAKATVAKGKGSNVLSSDSASLEDIFGIDLGGDTTSNARAKSAAAAKPAKSTTPTKAAKKPTALAVTTPTSANKKRANAAKTSRKKGSSGSSVADAIVAEFVAAVRKVGRR